MDSLEQKYTPIKVRQALEELSKELDDVYSEALKRINGQHDDCQLAKKVLYWITYAFEPLSVGGLMQALATEPDMTSLNDRDLYEPEDLLLACAGLVVVDESSIIRFVRM